MKRVHDKIFQLARILEIVISISIILAVGISLLTLGNGLTVLFLHPLNKDNFQEFLAIAFNILIGIEFLKMIFKYNLDTVIEVLLFAIARQIIVGHTTVYENGAGVISIAVLFAIRKYLFVPDTEREKKKYN